MDVNSPRSSFVGANLPVYYLSLPDFSSPVLDDNKDEKSGTKSLTLSVEKEPVFVKLPPGGMSKKQAFKDRVLLFYSTSKNASELSLKCKYDCLKTFTRHFKKYFKQTPYQWMLDRKMKEIHSLVMNSDLSVSEISKMYHFKNVAHLISAYQNKFGIPPKRNRKLHYAQIR